jgi:hypothetical protein
MEHQAGAVTPHAIVTRKSLVGDVVDEIGVEEVPAYPSNEV